MNKVLSVLAPLASSVLLAGCSLNTPTPAMTYHLLDHKEVKLEQRLPKAKVALSKVRLTDYLLQPNLVMRRDSNQLELANYHHWAEPLDKAVQRILIAKLNQQNPNYGTVNHCIDCKQLSLFIEHFYPNEQGQVVLSGYFVIGQGKASDEVEYFRLSGSQRDAGYAASVEVMRQLLDELSSQMASALTQKGA